MRNVLVSILLVLVSGVACSQNAQEVRKSIDRANAALSHVYASGDIDAAAKFFAEGAWQMPPSGPSLVRRDAIAQSAATARVRAGSMSVAAKTLATESDGRSDVGAVIAVWGFAPACSRVPRARDYGRSQ
ncbi:MAG: hypothetical protein ACRENQ_10045 [Gemmatimonadaceae bacterium]